MLGRREAETELRCRQSQQLSTRSSRKCYKSAAPPSQSPSQPHAGAAAAAPPLLPVCSATTHSSLTAISRTSHHKTYIIVFVSTPWSQAACCSQAAVVFRSLPAPADTDHSAAFAQRTTACTARVHRLQHRQSHSRTAIATLPLYACTAPGLRCTAVPCWPLFTRRADHHLLTTAALCTLPLHGCSLHALTTTARPALCSHTRIITSAYQHSGSAAALVCSLLAVRVLTHTHYVAACCRCCCCVLCCALSVTRRQSPSAAAACSNDVHASEASGGACTSENSQSTAYSLTQPAHRLQHLSSCVSLPPLQSSGN
jgi:hypothetical protein